MIWRLEHPVRGIAAGVAVLMVAQVLIGFGMGLPELGVVLLLALAVTVLTARSGRARPPRAGDPGADVTGPCEA